MWARTFSLSRARPQQLVLAGARAGLDPVAELAVDLDDEREGVGLEQRGVGLRPGLLPDAPALEHLPDLGAEVGREGEDQRGGGGGGEADGGVAVGIAVEAVLEPVGVVDELHHGGDRRC